MKIVIGAAIAAFGWIYLVGFSGIDTVRGLDVINIHSVEIANNVIFLGYAIALWGVIEEGCTKIIKGMSVASETAPPNSTHSIETGNAQNTEQVEAEFLSDDELEERRKRLDAKLKSKAG